jgi:SAM-dependent methyltransferase
MTSGDANPPETDPRYDERYFEETFGGGEPGRLDMRWWSNRWYASIARRCLRQNNGRRLLEIGCGEGLILAQLEDEFETFGVDVSSYAIEQAGRYAPASRCCVADIQESLPDHLHPGSFDMLMARYVLEHVRQPAVALRNLAGLLKPGGILFFAVPYTESIGARWKGDEWYALQDPTHCSLLSRDEWLRQVREAGLPPHAESADGYWDLPYIRWLPTWLQAPFFVTPSALACLSGRALLPPRWGENILVFARKPAEAGPEQL